MCEDRHVGLIVPGVHGLLDVSAEATPNRVRSIYRSHGPVEFPDGTIFTEVHPDVVRGTIDIFRPQEHEVFQCHVTLLLTGGEDSERSKSGHEDWHNCVQPMQDGTLTPSENELTLSDGSGRSENEEDDEEAETEGTVTTGTHIRIVHR